MRAVRDRGVPDGGAGNLGDRTHLVLTDDQGEAARTRSSWASWTDRHGPGHVGVISGQRDNGHKSTAGNPPMARILLLHGWDWKKYPVFKPQHQWKSRQELIAELQRNYNVDYPSLSGFDPNDTHRTGSWTLNDYTFWLQEKIDFLNMLKVQPLTRSSYSFTPEVSRSKRRRPHYTRRRSEAQRDSSWRLDSWVLRSTDDTWVSTVLIEINSSAAISL